MSELIVAKAGGTSNANAAAMQQSLEWAEQADIFVVSAPGKLDGDGPEATKITDLLLEARDRYLADDAVPAEISDIIIGRYESIARGLSRSAVSGHWIDAIKPRIEEAVRHSKDAASMLGERLQAEIYQTMGFKLLDPGRSTHDLGSDPDAWRGWLDGAFVRGERHVLPGNITRENGQLVTFDKGGSDISSGFAAYGIRADLNLNLTDSSAMSTDPRLIARDRLRHIPHMLYIEGRELGRNGTGLVHPAAMIPLERGDIPTEIRSTFDRDQAPTVLDNDYARASKRRGHIIALSIMNDVVIHQIHESGMSGAIGRLAEFDTSLASHEFPIIDSQGDGVDGQKYFIEKEHGQAALEALRSAVKHGKIESKTDVDLITMVGFDLEKRLFDLMVELLLESGIDSTLRQAEQFDLTHGKHSLRLGVDRAVSNQVFDRLHHHFLES